ncbi:MAG: type IV pilus biogenesis/stability protein PilW [Betaproteobacteria bacterium]|nr:type IV pilus biogenesis/stability protein PilW [Betaproteobacteria bacterium]
MKSLRASVCLAFAVATFLPLTGCVSQTTVESKPADIATSSDPGQRAQIRTALASEYYQRRNFAIAIEEAESALKAIPTYSPAHMMLGLIYMEIGDDGKARTSFEQALRLAPNDPDVLNNFGWFLCQRGDARRAMPMFQQALRVPLYSTPQRALLNAGICAGKLGNVADAEQYLRQALQLQPQLQLALAQLADITFRAGRYQDAGRYLSQYSKLQSLPDADMLLLAVRISRALGDKSNAESYLLQLERRFPEAPQTRQARGGG